MVYGIQNAERTGFLQYAVIDLRAFFRHYADGTIKVNTSRKYSYYSGGVLYCGHNKNKDNSSSFVCVNIALLSEAFSDVVVYQEYCPRRPFFKWKEVAEYVYQLMKYNFLVEAGMLSTNPAVMYETMRFTANDFVHHEEKQKKADIQRRAQMKYALDKCKK